MGNGSAPASSGWTVAAGPATAWAGVSAAGNEAPPMTAATVILSSKESPRDIVQPPGGATGAAADEPTCSSRFRAVDGPLAEADEAEGSGRLRVNPGRCVTR